MYVVFEPEDMAVGSDLIVRIAIRDALMQCAEALTDHTNPDSEYENLPAKCWADEPVPEVFL